MLSYVVLRGLGVACSTLAIWVEVFVPRRPEVEAASGKSCIFHKFSVWNSGASSGDVRKLRVQWARLLLLFGKTADRSVATRKEGVSGRHSPAR